MGEVGDEDDAEDEDEDDDDDDEDDDWDDDEDDDWDDDEEEGEEKKWRELGVVNIRTDRLPRAVLIARS